MKVFIFGAGASFGSQPEAVSGDKKAPLTRNLFDEQYQSVASGVGIREDDLASYREQIKSSGMSLEAWLTKKWEEKKEYIDQFRRIEDTKFGQLVFYLWRLFQLVSDTYNNENAYGVLVKKLIERRQPFGLISFNYDTFLDRALHQSQVHLGGNIQSYIERDYIKPHGSVNWLLPFRPSDPRIPPEGTHNVQARIDAACDIMFRGEPRDIQETKVFVPYNPDLKELTLLTNSTFSSQYFIPFIILPLILKEYSHLKGFDQLIMEGAKKLLGKATEVFLIGYRASDEIIKDMFSAMRPNAKLTVVGVGSAPKIADEVMKWARSLNKGLVFTDGFMEFTRLYSTPEYPAT